MFADTHQTGTLEVSRLARSIRLGRMAGWLIIGLVVASLLGGLFWNQNSVRYPGAEPQAATQFQLRFQPIASLSQQSVYQTPDDLPRVLGWYAQHFGQGHEMPQGENCITMTQVDTKLFFQQSLNVTLCAQSTRTPIFVNRTLAVH